MQRLLVREHGAVDLSSTPHPERARDALLAATATLREEVFRVDRRGRLRVTGVVGMVQAGGVSVEILPKVTSGSTTADDLAFLRALLTAARLVPQRLVTPALVAHARMPLLELVIRQAAEHMQTTLGAHGVPRRYEEVHEDRETVLGVIDMNRAMRQMPHERNRIPVIHAPLNVDNGLSRLLRALATALYRITASTLTRQLLADVVDQLSGAGNVPLSLHVVDQAAVSPHEEHWRPEQELARGLCDGRMPNPTLTGQTGTHALVFGLDDIFEKVLRRALAVALRHTGWHLATHTRARHFLVDTETGKRRLRLRPDILVAADDDAAERLQVADAKWKTVTVGHAGITLDRNDVYQLSAYMNRYRLDRGVLLVPAGAELGRVADAPWSRRLRIDGSSSFMDVVAVDVHALVGPDKAARQRALRHLAHTFASKAS